MLRHGAPKSLKGDQEFNKCSFRNWLEQRGIEFQPVPSRRHNKTGMVERKNRVIKDALEKLENDARHAKLHINQRMTMAQFTSNILYGGKLLSSFEMVRGYTPGIEGTKQKQVPRKIWEAFQQMQARRLLARMAKSLPRKAKQEELSVGDAVLCLTPGGKRPRGEWVEQKIDSIPDPYSVIVGTGKNKKIIAREDVRKLPSNDLARTVVRAEHDTSSISRKVSEEPLSDEEEVLEDYLSSDEELHEKQTREVDLEKNMQETEMGEHTENIIDEIEEVPTRESKDESKDKSDGELENDNTEEEQPESMEDANIPRSRYGRPLIKTVRYTGMTNEYGRGAITEQEHLREVYNHFQGSQFYDREAPFLPHHLIIRADREKLKKNWEKNMVELPIEVFRRLRV